MSNDLPVPATPTPIAVKEDDFAELLQTGDLSLLEPADRGRYLYNLALKLGLNPISRPFDFIQVAGPDGKKRTILYANRTASDQLRFNHQIESEILYAGPLRIGDLIRPDVYVVELLMKLPLSSNPDGTKVYRTERHLGCVAIGTYQGDKPILNTGEALANAIMKCHTKALRRGTLSIVGLGFPDETEIPDTSPSVEPTLVERPAAPRRLIPPSIPDPDITPAQPEAPANIITPLFPRPLPAAKPPRS